VDEDGAIRAARLAMSRGLVVTTDLDRVTDRTAEFVASVTIPIFAEDVPRALTGEPDPERSLRRLRRGHHALLCVTLGASGALAIQGDRAVRVPAFQVEAVDTTGAGDLFRAGFICAHLEGKSIEETLRFANAAAALGCTRMGAMPGIPTRDEVDALLTRGCLPAR
jgi:sugar/nucleoside kinase (ribokinase family)